MLADRRLYANGDWSRLVNECDAAFLLAGKGQEIAPELVKRLDLQVWSDGRVMQGPEPVQMPEPEPEPEPVVMDEPLADVVQPAGAMPEPIMPPEVKRSRKKY